MKKRNKILILVIIIFLILSFLIVGTYAFWSWSGINNAKKLVINTGSGLDDSTIKYEEGSSSFVGNFQPTDNFCQSVNNTISFSKTSEISDLDVFATIYMDVNSIGENISLSDDVYWIVTSGDSSIACDEGLDTSSVLSYGTFKEKTNADQIKLLSNIEVTLSEQKFTVWIWIDSSGETIANLSGETIDTNIWTEISSFNLQPEKPVLDPGMVPVTIANDGTVTTILENNSDWYDYNNKEWANVVLVDSDSRSNYLNTSGKTVDQDDILAYYVWIPRYKYQIWTTDATKITSPKTINIEFEYKNDVVSKGSVVGEYMTHPAFIWDGEPVAGIWIGKFETSADKASTCYTTSSSDNCNNTNQSPRIVPNVSSLRYQDIGNQFKTSLKFANGTMSGSTVSFTKDENNIYGLNTISNTTNSHMMKNSEWGAVAYLSHSKYGINTEIAKNASSSYTGYGTSSLYKYGVATSYPQSTTGNITGVFDMSGGSWEFVMGNYGNKTSTYFSILPESKYYDIYTSEVFKGTEDTNTSLCSLQTCGGAALYETSAWYDDYTLFVYSGIFWFSRGGYRGNGVGAGAFGFYRNGGAAGENYSWRSVIITGV